MPCTILFLCPHNAAKSVFAAAYCRELAARYGLDVIVDSAGTEPDAQIWPSVTELLRADGIEVSDWRPRALTQHDLDRAYRVISMGCDLSAFRGSDARLQRWDDVPMASQDLLGARDAIRSHVQALLDELRAAELSP